jgi:hypothetical protein
MLPSCSKAGYIKTSSFTVVSWVQSLTKNFILVKPFINLFILFRNLFYCVVKGDDSVGNHFFQTLAKMASGLKQVFAKM